MRLHLTKNYFNRLGLLVFVFGLLWLVGVRGQTNVQAATIQAVLINAVDTSLWSPNSPDPAGIEYRASTNTLLITDSEVEEMPNYFQGKNMYESSLNGTLINTSSTTAFSTEPTGLALNPSNGHIFISDDNKKKIFEINLGNDNLFGTSDDIVTSFLTSGFGSTDPEGLAFGLGRIFIADGVGTEVYVIAPGANDIFDGVDDQITHFDTSLAGQADPEGIAFNPDSGTIYVVTNNGGKLANKITEFSITGEVINEIDISFLAARSTAGLAYGPGSNNPSQNSIYIVARGVDNNSDPNENDGRIYEIAVSTSITPTPTPTPTIQANLLTNAGFELDANIDTRPDNWTSKSFFTRSNTIVQAGSFSGRHLSTANRGYTILQNVSGIIAGSNYNFSGWTNIPTTSDTFSYKLQVKWLNSSGATISTKTVKTYSTATSGWDQFSGSLVAPTGAVTAAIRMNLTSLKATIYTDELIFKKL